MRILSFALLICGLSGVAGAQSKSKAREPYVLRGDSVEAKYNSYFKQLQLFYDSLHARVEREAPELVKRLEPPAAEPYGYQLLPSITQDGPRMKGRIRLSPFSWTRTEGILDWDRSTVDSLRRGMGELDHLPGMVKKAAYTRIVDMYVGISKSQKLLENWIHYNRFWQDDIATNKSWYAKMKVLQRVAIERERVSDSLATDSGNMRLRFRKDSLTRMIDDGTRKLPTPSFVRIAHPDNHTWIFNVPMYTDIEDSAFVERFKSTVESAWHVSDNGDDFQVRLDMHRMSPAALYGKGAVPARGAHIDITEHLKRFPSKAGVLTTGAEATRAEDRGVILGPHATAPAVLVHEFGHVLGFKDGYFRSYEDRGAEGYEVLEVILPPEDVVAAPEGGWVRREHFEQILSEKRH